MNTSVYAKPVMPRIVVRPALATIALHALLIYMVAVGWSCSERDTIRVAPAPKAINRHTVEASQPRFAFHNDLRECGTPLGWCSAVFIW